MNTKGLKVRCAIFLVAFSSGMRGKKMEWEEPGSYSNNSPAISSPHRLSLAGCSPAEPASVSPDELDFIGCGRRVQRALPGCRRDPKVEEYA